MEPKDWLNTGLEDEAGGVTVPNSGLDRHGVENIRPLRGFDVELRRKPGEGFGFVIASQDVENGKGESPPHRGHRSAGFSACCLYVYFVHRMIKQILTGIPNFSGPVKPLGTCPTGFSWMPL